MTDAVCELAICSYFLWSDNHEKLTKMFFCRLIQNAFLQNNFVKTSEQNLQVAKNFNLFSKHVLGTWVSWTHNNIIMLQMIL